MESAKKLTAESGFTLPGYPDPFTAGEAVLERAKSVAQRIADRVRELTEDTASQSALPGDPTDVHPHLSE
jgi:hypothetical protein